MKTFSLKTKLKNIRVQIILLLTIIGPGLITAFADNDAGGVATYSSAAARFGYFSLITLIPITFVLAITQEIGGRIAIVTGKGLGDIIRERFGIRVAVFVFFALFLVNFGVILQNLGGLRAGLELFNLDYRLFLPILIGFLFLFITHSNYKKIQQFFFVLIFFYLAYLISAFLAKPDWNRAVTAIVIPEKTPSFEFMFTSIAVLGTTVTAWGQFFINSFVKDKKVKTENLAYSQFEIIIGSILTNLFSFFMMIAVAATIYSNGIHIDSAADAARAMQPLAGVFASSLFGFGLLIAGFLGCAIVPLATAYAFSEFFGYQGTLNDGFKQSKLFYGFFIIQILLGAIIIFIPSISLFKITLIADFCNGMMLPVIFFFLYKIANNEELMGNYKNTRLKNVLLIGSGVVICIGTALGGFGKLFGL